MNPMNPDQQITFLQAMLKAKEDQLTEAYRRAAEWQAAAQLNEQAAAKLSQENIELKSKLEPSTQESRPARAPSATSKRKH